MTIQSYKIEIASDTTESNEFLAWLIEAGHDASIGNSTGNYVDGIWTSTDENANKIMRDLWESYCNGDEPKPINEDEAIFNELVESGE